MLSAELESLKSKKSINQMTCNNIKSPIIE